MSSISSSADFTTTTSLLGDDNNKNRIVYWQDDTLLIRRFEPDDTRAAQDLFCVANRTSMFPQALWQFGMSPMFLGGTALAVAAVHSTVRLACQRLLPLITAQRNGTPHSNGGDDSPLSSLLTSLTTHANWWTWSASMATLLLSYWSLHRSTVQAVDKFMHRNLSDDMWQIGTVYLGHPAPVTTQTTVASSVNGQDKNNDDNKVVVDHGNYGNFIVAIDKASGALIGCVGGHDRTNEQHKDDETKPYLGIFELRRMAVHPDHRRRSLARHLMRVLEESLLNQQQQEQQQQTKSLQRQGTSIYLTCSTIQRAASFLYHKCGYTIVDSYRPTKAPLWIRYSGLTVFRFEKQTLYPNQKGESKPTTPTTPTTTC